MFYPTTCVSLRYGCRTDITLSGFSRESAYSLYRIVPKDSPYCQVRIRWWICLPPSAPTPFNRLFRQPAGLSLLRLRIAPYASKGILTLSSIGLSLRMSLRSRLTLIRLALIRNPWSYGEGVSRPLYRYLYLHLLFHTLQSASMHAFDAEWNAPLPIFTYPTASADGLYPIIIHAQFLD